MIDLTKDIISAITKSHYETNAVARATANLTLEDIKDSLKLVAEIGKNPFEKLMFKKGFGELNRYLLILPKTFIEQNPELERFTKEKWIKISDVIADSEKFYIMDTAIKIDPQFLK